MRLIDADALHNFVSEEFKDDVPYEWAWALTAVDHAPVVDAVEVVRCKDCKHYKPQKKSAHWENRTNYCNRIVTIKVQPYDFCSYGERKEGDK